MVQDSRKYRSDRTTDVPGHWTDSRSGGERRSGRSCVGAEWPMQAGSINIHGLTDRLSLPIPASNAAFSTSYDARSALLSRVRTPAEVADETTVPYELVIFDVGQPSQAVHRRVWAAELCLFTRGAIIDGISRE